MKHIEYLDLGSANLLDEVQEHGEVACVLSPRQCKMLKSNWDKYHKYWNSKQQNPGSLGTALRGVIWLTHRAYMSFSHEHLDHINDVYLEGGNLLGPVEIKPVERKNGRNVAIAVLRKRTSNETPSLH